MEDIHTLALSGRFAPQILQNDTLQRYLRAYGRQPRPNAPNGTRIRWVQLENEHPASHALRGAIAATALVPGNAELTNI